MLHLMRKQTESRDITVEKLKNQPKVITVMTFGCFFFTKVKSGCG